MAVIQAVKSLLLYSVNVPVLYTNFRLNCYKEVIWLIGDGRSGTTWLSSLMNHNKNHREMFEPFHPLRVKASRFLRRHQYLRPDESNDQLWRLATDVFTGRFTSFRVDSDNRSLLYNGLIIKDIFANLFSYWVSRRFPDVKIILLVRNPFAVALSKSKKRSWLWLTEPMELLEQECLLEDYLRPYEDLIRETSRRNNFILNQILIWSILNYVPMHQFKAGEIHVVFYEHLFADPIRQVSEIVRFVRPRTGSVSEELDSRLINRPSRFSDRESSIVSGISPVDSWKTRYRRRMLMLASTS